MSPVWFKIIAVLSLSYTALCGQEGDEVLWRENGGSLTIECRGTESQDIQLVLRKGLKENISVMVKDRSGYETIGAAFRGRLQIKGQFPNVDIHIKNITSDDTGPFWCKYLRLTNDNQYIEQKGNGSVLLVVTVTTQPGGQCDPAGQEDKSLILVAVVISGAVLLGIILGFIIWLIIKTKTSCSRVEIKNREDVYEDMRGTIRR